MKKKHIWAVLFGISLIMVLALVLSGHRLLKERKRAAGLFSKEKKQWNAQLNDCEAELAETQTKLDEERQQTELEIFVCEQKRSELLALLKHFTGRVWFAEKETTMALALAEEGEQCPDAVEIGLQPFLKIRDVKVSPHEKDNTADSGRDPGICHGSSLLRIEFLVCVGRDEDFCRR